MIIGYEPEKVKCKMITPSGAFHFKGYVRNYDTERKVCDVVAENNIVYSEVPFDRIMRIDEGTPLPWEDKYLDNMKDYAEVLRGKEYILCHIDEFDMKDQVCNISIDDGIDEVTGNPVVTKYNEVPFSIMKRTRVGETIIPFPWEREREDNPSRGTYYHKYAYPFDVEFQVYEGLCSYPCMLIWYDTDANICTVSTRLFNKYFVKLTDVVKMPDGPELPWKNDPRFKDSDKRIKGVTASEYDFYQYKIEKLKDCGDIMFYGNWRHCHIDDYDAFNRSCTISLSKNTNPNDDDLKDTIQLTDVPFTSIRHIRIYNTTLLLPWEHSKYINDIKYIKNRPKDAYKPKLDLNETLNTGVPDNMLTEPEFRQNLSLEDALKIVKIISYFGDPARYTGAVGQAFAVLTDYIDNTKSFLNFVAREIFDESNEEFDNWGAFCELACRRLVKLDAIKLEDGNCMLKEEDEKTYVKSDVIKRDDYDRVVARIRTLSPDDSGTDDYDDGYFACKHDVTKELNEL